MVSSETFKNATEVSFGWDENDSKGGSDVTPKPNLILESQRNERLAQAFNTLQRLFVEGAQIDAENERIVFMNAHYAMQVYHTLVKDDFYKKFGLTALELREESIYIHVG